GERGYDEATMVESFVVLNALGGECLEDFTHLRGDGGLKEMLGHEIPSPEAARQFLYQFHAVEKIEEAKQRREAEQIAFIPEENEALAGLGEVNRELVKEVAKRAFAALPHTVQTYYFRGDSACHESNLVDWLRDEQRGDGPQGSIGFAISARMSNALHEAILQVPEEQWEVYGEPHPQEIRE